MISWIVNFSRNIRSKSLERYEYIIVGTVSRLVIFNIIIHSSDYSARELLLKEIM